MANKTPFTIASFILKHLKPFPWQLTSFILVALYWSIHVSLQPYLIKLILDGVNTQMTFSQVFLPVLFYILIAIFFTVTFRFYDYVSLNFYPRLKANLIQESTDYVTDLSYHFFQNQLAGSLSDKIKNLAKGTIEIVRLFFDSFLSHILALIIACATLMTVNPILSLILLGWTVLLISVSVLSAKQASKLSHELSEASSHVMGRIVDRFSNILNVRLFANQQPEKKLLTEDLDVAIQKDKKLRWFLLKVLSVQGFATAIMISSCVLVLVLSARTRPVSVGDFGLVLTLTISFAEIMWNFARSIADFSEVYGTVQQGVRLLNQPFEIKDDQDAQLLSVKNGDIAFENVHFKYHEADPLFVNKSILLRGGEKVGLVGLSGSGKTTFVNLILRLYDVNEGGIFIDKQNIKKVTQQSLHQVIGIIPQEPQLFHRSLMDNIRYGRLNATDEEVIDAAKLAQAHEFIAELHQGYHTLVGERGIKLSGGQRQRIAIARAILKDAPILLLDEATSALDSITENLIKHSLSDLMENKTTVIIAHRLSTLLNMDRILVFDAGKIVEDGSHETLLRAGGLYKTLWNAQIGGFIPDQIHGHTPQNALV